MGGTSSMCYHPHPHMCMHAHIYDKHKILVREPEGTTPVWRPRHRQQDIKMNLK